MTSVELLNKLLQNEIPEFDGTIENRNTFINDNPTQNGIGKYRNGVEVGSICHWVDKPYPESVELVVLRKATRRELKIWNAYKQMIDALYNKGETNIEN